ncbi:MAG: hypothetical protein DELT_01393 [Desulfovibrio sp.]
MNEKKENEKKEYVKPQAEIVQFETKNVVFANASAGNI